MKTLFLLAKNVELFGLKKLKESVAIFAPRPIFKKYSSFLIGEIDLDQRDIYLCDRILFHADFVPIGLPTLANRFIDCNRGQGIRWEVMSPVGYGQEHLRFDAQTTTDQFCKRLNAFGIALFDVQPLFKSENGV